MPQKTRSDRKIYRVRRKKKKKCSLATSNSHHTHLTPEQQLPLSSARHTDVVGFVTVSFVTTSTTSARRQGLAALPAATTPMRALTHKQPLGRQWEAATGHHQPPARLREIPSSSLAGLLCMASLAGQRPELLSAETSAGDTWNGITLKFSRWKTPRLDYVIIFNCNSSMK